jgi:hypothetical protein
MYTYTYTYTCTYTYTYTYLDAAGGSNQRTNHFIWGGRQADRHTNAPDTETRGLGRGRPVWQVVCGD